MSSSNESNHGLITERIYVKNLSLESHGNMAVGYQQMPEVNLGISLNSTRMAENTHEVVLIITATAKLHNQLVYLAEIHQAGLFVVPALLKEDLHRLLGSSCPNILFPYARENLTLIVNKGGLPQLHLNHVNFERTYEQTLQKQRQAMAEQQLLDGV